MAVIRELEKSHKCLIINRLRFYAQAQLSI